MQRRGAYLVAAIAVALALLPRVCAAVGTMADCNSAWELNKAAIIAGGGNYQQFMSTCLGTNPPVQAGIANLPFGIVQPRAPVGGIINTQ